ncbi:MAG: histidine phosphatase family protein [Ilumatobacteraceae bacterium]
MELILIRHSLPVRRVVEVGIADPELSETGIQQAERIAEYLANEKIEFMYTSPLKRSLQTAEPLAEKLGLKPVVVDDIAEYDRDSSEYIPIEELRATKHPRWQKMLDGEWDAPHETIDQFKSRVVGAIESIIENHRSSTVAVVCHGAVINHYLASILGIATVRGFFYPNYGSIHRVFASRKGPRSLMTLNESADRI